MMQYRVKCSMATDHWNRNPSNQYSKMKAEKTARDFDKSCPGKHTVEPIEDK